MNDLVSISAITLLRQRLIDDMEVRRFSRETQRNHIRDIGRFATFLRRSPDTATAEDIRRFQIEQLDAGAPVPTMNSIVSALRFFFIYTIDRPDLARRLIRAGITFRYKDYRRDGAERFQTMTLAPAEFIRRFLLHVLPRGFHRIRHYGLLASATRKDNIARIRALLAVPQPTVPDTSSGEPGPEPWRRCPCCGGPMVIIEILAGSIQPRAPPSARTAAGREVS